MHLEWVQYLTIVVEKCQKILPSISLGRTVEFAMLYLDGECAFCLQGVHGVRRCDDGATLVVMCDECEAIWLDPEDLSLNAVRFPDSSTSIPGTTLKAFRGASGWATPADVERAGWQRYIKGEAHPPGLNLRK